MPGNATLQDPSRRRQSNPTPDSEPELTIDQARLNRTTNPPGLALQSQVMWERAFRRDSREALLLTIASLEPKAAQLRILVQHPPDYWHGKLWQDAADRLDEWEGMLAAARKALDGGRSSDLSTEKPSGSRAGLCSILMQMMSSSLLDW